MLQELALKGKFNQVDGVILGTNRDEGRYLMPILMPVPNAPHSDVHERHVSDSLYSDTKLASHTQHAIRHMLPSSSTL